MKLLVEEIRKIMKKCLDEMGKNVRSELLLIVLKCVSKVSKIDISGRINY